MPIHCPIAIQDLSQAEFDKRDRVVMRCAYAAQNTLGRLMDERVYENDLALRLQAEGFTVHTQVPVIATHGSFKKEHHCDLIAHDALYELKTVTAFTGEHEAKALHYAMMLGVRHAKLVNFRLPQVKGWLRFNAVSTSDRHSLEWDVARWSAMSERCGNLLQHARDILEDWGAYLECRLYEEALVHFMGGETGCRLRVPVIRDRHELGTHTLCSHAPGLFFSVSALADNLGNHESHLRRLMRFTGHRGAQWLNLSHNRIQLVTLKANE
jgi:GxxExxY protein